jgi:6-pyruvoyltetrahydropterin/6-carboxytetrahydropterin synthase
LEALLFPSPAPTPGSSFLYEIGIIDFFNARHAVNGEPPHSHSWKVEVRLRRKRYMGEQSLIDVNQTRARIRALFTRYEDQFLNEVPPFTFQQPTVENLVAYLYEQIDHEFRGTEVVFYALTIWDSPTSFVTYTMQD